MFSECNLRFEQLKSMTRAPDFVCVKDPYYPTLSISTTLNLKQCLIERIHLELIIWVYQLENETHTPRDLNLYVGFLSRDIHTHAYLKDMMERLV